MEHPHNQVSCRFYEDDFPRQGDLVIGKVIEVEENGCYVDLLEYANKRGLITPNEYTTYMQKAIKKAISPNAEEVVRVVSVDREKGYIDLSKKKVDKSEVDEVVDNYSKAKTVHSIARSVAEHVKVPIIDVLKVIVWPIYKTGQKPLEVFKEFLNDEALLLKYAIPPTWQEKLLNEIRRRFEQPVIKINAKFQLKINDFDGINAIKRALQAGKSKSRPNFDLLITIIGAPVYLITVETRRKKQGIEVVNEGMDAIKAYVKEKGGSFKIKEPATVVKDKNKQEDQDEEVVLEGSDSSGMGDADMNIDDIETIETTDKSSVVSDI